MISNATAGRFVCIEIVDTGCGMKDETRARISDPFFSTESSGGVGLAAVSGIIRSHYGAVHVIAQLGEGTQVVVMLPASA